ncbi:uncharacterized protein LOC105665447 [Ceratitis capitata]|uniref:(Mediterranean fruit fly) hypothetical protein n=1 Tax=Ceratitis capitata TaxID=7213 RepID=A0A811UZG0_CERCA|nr:uncharacterized protein LOC105665447 [Ceratitis capitata]CAD7003036.1 unnamed protein product [Ceratitis capitata]
MDYFTCTKLWILLLVTVCSSTATHSWRLHYGYGSNAISTTTRAFKCQSRGLFPDPYDCRSYYDCTSDGTHTHHRCAFLQRYSANMQACAFAWTVICYTPTFKCIAEGDSGAWPGDARIFYVCQANGSAGNLIPVFLKCESGSSFNGSICV